MISIVRPIASSSRIRWSDWASEAVVPSAATTTSPGSGPACSAGLSGTTCAIRSAVLRQSGRDLVGHRHGRGDEPEVGTADVPVLDEGLDDPRVVALIGTARPSPTPATAVLMPTTRARESASAPPELPGLSAASVWMTSSTSADSAARRASAASDRAR